MIMLRCRAGYEKNGGLETYHGSVTNSTLSSTIMIYVLDYVPFSETLLSKSRMVWAVKITF